MPRDLEKLRAWKRRRRDEAMVAKYGPYALTQNMSGRHGRHAKATRNGRWNEGRMLSSHGYVLVRVGKGHPLAFGNGYAYEHELVATVALGRPLAPNETVHHLNGEKTDNRWDNLWVSTRSDHAKVHAEERGRDALGRFPPKQPEDLRVREIPKR